MDFSQFYQLFLFMAYSLLGQRSQNVLDPFLVSIYVQHNHTTAMPNNPNYALKAINYNYTMVLRILIKLWCQQPHFLSLCKKIPVISQSVSIYYMLLLTHFYICCS